MHALFGSCCFGTVRDAGTSWDSNLTLGRCTLRQWVWSVGVVLKQCGHYHHTSNSFNHKMLIVQGGDEIVDGKVSCLVYIMCIG